MTPQEKQQAVADLNARFTKSPASFLVSYQGCSCEELTALRKDLRPSGAHFAVVKNTLAKIAIEKTDAADLREQFSGPVAVIWSDEDPVAPAKLVTNFAKDNDNFSVKAGVVDGKVVAVSEIESLASLPSREEVLAKLLALINAPATQLVQMINAPATHLARLLAAWKAEIEKRDN